MNNKPDAYILRMNRLKQRNILEEKFKYHTHHIIPTFMGGADTEENTVKLSIEEHIEAHLELAECFPIGSEERNKNLCSANITKVWANKLNIQIDISGENNPMWGKFHSEATKKKIGQRSAKKYFSEEYREKLRNASLGTNNPMWGKTHKEETKRKISEAQLGTKHHWYGKSRPEDVKNKIRKSQPNKKTIAKCDLTGNIIDIYESIGIAAKKNNISQGNLSVYLKSSPVTKHGKCKQLGGYIWKTIGEELL
jgi:hypothetical protein